MKPKGKIRLLVTMTLIALLLGAFVTGKIFIIPTEHDKQEFTRTIHEIELLGGNPQEKIARLSAIIEARYQETAIAGQYGINPMSGTDYVEYEVTLQFLRPNDPIAYKEVTELKDRILGELSIGTVKLLSVETQIPTIGRNILNDMVITVTTIYTEPANLEKYEASPESKVGGFFNPGPFLQQEAEKITYTFGELQMLKLLKETDTLKWSKYAIPKPHAPAIPNTGVIENPKPLVPDK